ncbi:MAG: 50S ribosomal protein L25 [Patescibacteria group bacterium]|nr:50S ribosomal protein L25 [Patescibacteria group bacterium]
MTISLKVFRRNKFSSKSLKKDNNVIGVMYGPQLKEALGIPSVPVYASLKDFFQFYRVYESTLFDVLFEDGEYQGLVKEIQIDPITNQIIHFDIYLPSLDKRVRNRIPVEFIGDAPVVKKGGVLSFNVNEVEVLALPHNLPESIVVDVSRLEEIGQSIRVKELNISKGIKILLEDNFPLVTVISGQEESTQSNV